MKHFSPVRGVEVGMNIIEYHLSYLISADYLEMILCTSFLGHHIMPECQNCGTTVTDRYVRVFTPEGQDNPRVCPDCDDLVRDGADVRPARSPRG